MSEVILEGWYETEEGLLPVHETGSHLEEIVDRLVDLDQDFGHTDMEFQLIFPSGTEIDVAKLISTIVEKKVGEHYCTTKGLGWAFVTCMFLILGVPVLMWLALEGADWYERFDLMNPMW